MPLPGQQTGVATSQVLLFLLLYVDGLQRNHTASSARLPGPRPDEFIYLGLFMQVDWQWQHGGLEWWRLSPRRRLPTGAAAQGQVGRQHSAATPSGPAWLWIPVCCAAGWLLDSAFNSESAVGGAATAMLLVLRQLAKHPMHAHVT